MDIKLTEGKSRASKIGITSVEALTWNAFLLLGIIGVLLFPYDFDRQDPQRAFWPLALFRRIFKDDIVHLRSRRRNFAEIEKVSDKRRSNRGFGCRWPYIPQEVEMRSCWKGQSRVSCGHSFIPFQPIMPLEFETVKGDTLYREMMAYCFSPRFAAVYQIGSLSISVLEVILDLVILVNLKTTIAVPKKVGNGETLAS
jgi:hypothetical protein